MSKRDCKNCKHYKTSKDGIKMCEVWTCDFKPKNGVDIKIRAEQMETDLRNLVRVYKSDLADVYTNAGRDDFKGIVNLYERVIEDLCKILLGSEKI